MLAAAAAASLGGTRNSKTGAVVLDEVDPEVERLRQKVGVYDADRDFFEELADAGAEGADADRGRKSGKKPLRLTDYLREELLRNAGGCVTGFEGALVFKHLIAQPKMIPLPNFLESAAPAESGPFADLVKLIHQTR